MPWENRNGEAALEEHGSQTEHTSANDWGGSLRGETALSRRRGATTIGVGVGAAASASWTSSHRRAAASGARGIGLGRLIGVDEVCAGNGRWIMC